MNYWQALSSDGRYLIKEMQLSELTAKKEQPSNAESM